MGLAADRPGVAGPACTEEMKRCLHYWAGYMPKIRWWIDIARTPLGTDAFRKPFFAHFLGIRPLLRSRYAQSTLGLVGGETRYRRHVLFAKPDVAARRGIHHDAGRKALDCHGPAAVPEGRPSVGCRAHRTRCGFGYGTHCGEGVANVAGGRTCDGRAVIDRRLVADGQHI